MADLKISELTNLTAADPANDMIPIVDVSATPPASGSTKRISINNILACSPTATLASATITGDLTVATDRLKVVTGSTAIQTGATTQLQVGTTAWPSSVIGKSGSRSLFGNTGEVIIWNESAAGIGNYSTLIVAAKTGAGATTMGGLQIRAGIENASNSDGFVSLWTSNNTAGGFVERYKIDSTGVSTWSVGGSTAMTLNATGLGVGTIPGASTGSSKIAVVGGATYDGNFDIIANFTNSTASAAKGVLLGYNNSTNNGIISAAYGSGTEGLTFWTHNGSSWGQRMELTATGNVGIGVTPSAWSAGGFVQLPNSRAFAFAGSAGDYISNGYYDGSWKYTTTAAVSRYRQDAGSHQWFTAPSGTANDPISFGDAKMTLNASGALLIGQTTAGLDAQGGFWLREASSAFGSSIIINHRTAVGTGNSYAEFTHNGIGIGSITQNGTTGVLYNTTSDYRLKESVQPIANGLARVNALKPSIYKWKADGSNGEGFLAHELAEVVPAAVSGEKDAVNEDGSIKPQGVDMSRVVPILVAAIQELTARVQTLETR